jgi:hypothetical protein
MIEEAAKDYLLNPAYAAMTTGDQRALFYVDDKMGIGVYGSVIDNLMNIAQTAPIAISGEAEKAAKGGIMFDKRWQLDDRAEEGVPKPNEPSFDMAPVSDNVRSMAITVAALSLLELALVSDQEITRRPNRELRRRLDSELGKMKKEIPAVMVKKSGTKSGSSSSAESLLKDLQDAKK